VIVSNKDAPRRRNQLKNRANRLILFWRQFLSSAGEAGFAFLKNSRAFAEKLFACGRIAISTETAKDFG
jgi:hypothetical protein